MKKAEIAKQFPFADPQDYNFHVSWRNKTVIYEEESFFKRNRGWLKEWNKDWYNSLSEEDQVMYNWIDDEQVKNLGALKWKEVLEQIREEYSEYYGC